MVRAVHLIETMSRRRIASEGLYVSLLLLTRIVTGNVELERTAKRDVENLHTFTDREDRQPAGDRFFDGFEFPAIARRIDIFLEYRRIRNFLAQKFRRDIGAPGQKQTVGLIEIPFARERVLNLDLGMPVEKWLKPFFILRANPTGQVRHGRNFAALHLRCK